MGGVRVTGRKPTANEQALIVGRKAVKDRQRAIVEGRTTATTSSLDHSSLNEFGDNSVDSVITTTGDVIVDEAAAVAAGVAPGLTRNFLHDENSGTAPTAQPSFPAGDFHDSLQYHFFFPGMFLQGRIFHTRSMQHHSVWQYRYPDPSKPAEGRMRRLVDCTSHSPEGHMKRYTYTR